VLTPAALDALEALAGFNRERRRIMHERIQRRAARFRDGRRIGFLEPAAIIPRTQLTVQQARAAEFEGAEIPPDLQRQWIQGTGPATKPRSTVEEGIRNVAYALLSGADGWMFTARTRSARSTACRSTTSAISRSPSRAKIRF